MRIARSLIAAGVALAAACSGPKFTGKDCAETDCTGPSRGGSSNTGGTNAGEGGEAAAGTGTGGTATGGSSAGGSSAGGSSAGGSSTGGSSTGGSSTGGSSTGGSSTGGSSTGGSPTGGVATGGITSGGADTGGFSATGGSAGTGTAGRGGSGPPTFPANGILDDFDRDGPELGVAWTGSTGSYELTNQTLTCAGGYCEGIVWFEEFGVAQEVFATLTSFSNRSEEINLVLKAQARTDTNTNCDLIELFYSPILERLTLTGCWFGLWHTVGFVNIAFVPGDELGGRVGTDGFIDLFRNRMQVGRFDANDCPYIDLGGSIGVNGIVGTDGEPNAWDDFGGGDL